ncbi:nucleotide-diphospho-sugar transferase [Thozetella sp. PMI_491]|nr:nucleotide-diphospho-sugar transferase [Thozetella sp. PMI_491]
MLVLLLLPIRHRSSLPLPFTSEGSEGFWRNVFASLQDVRPTASPVHHDTNAPGENWHYGIDHERADLVVMSPEDVTALRTSHDKFVGAIPALARMMPFTAGTVGIVMTAGPPNFGQAVSSFIMIRQSGSELPVDVILDSTSPWIETLCEGPLKTLRVNCINASEIWQSLKERPPKIERFQWKPVAMLMSSFETVLFLDADTFPIMRPDPIFEPGVEPFASHGLITWPDFWTPSATHYFYEIAGDVPVPPLGRRSTSEAGVVVVDKKRHGHTLLLAFYYNFYGPEYYYPLLSQGAPGQGDKETLLQAAIVLEELEKKRSSRLGGSRLGGLLAEEKAHAGKYWDIKKMPLVHGRDLDGKWRGMFMQQNDPRDDFKSVTEARTAHSNAADNATDIDMPSEVWTGTVHDPFMFFHHNGVKLDFTRIVEDNAEIHARDANGTYVRLWSNPDWLAERVGKDVEKELWRAATQLYCRDTGLLDVCSKMADFYVSVF